MTHEYFTDLRIVELRLENFRSFRRARLSLEDLTFIVGRNAAGKSNLLDAVEFLRECLLDGPATALRRRDGFIGVRWHGAADSDPVGIAVLLRGRDDDGKLRHALYGYRLRMKQGLELEEEFASPEAPELGFERNGRGFFQGEPSAPDAPRFPVVASFPPAALVLADSGLPGGLAHRTHFALTRARSYQLAPSRIAELAETSSEVTLARDGRNAADVTATLCATSPATWQGLVRALGRVCEGIVDVRPGSYGSRVFLNFVRQNGDRHEFSASHASIGTLRALGILLAFAQQPSPSFVAIDEIEDSFHPGAFNVLIGEAEAASRSFPVVLTTHSPEVLSHPSATAARIRVIEWRDGSSEIFRLNERTTAAVGPLESVGDLLRENALGLAQSPETFPGDLLSL